MTAATRFQPASDQSLLVYFGEAITPDARDRVRKLLLALESEPIPGVRNVHPGYSSLLLKFDPLRSNHAQLESALRRYLDRIEEIELPEPRTIEIPVCYGGDCGPDLQELATLHNLTIEQIVAAHAAASYVVCFLGFLPGFAYLAGLPDALAAPRLATPRRQVPAGSVGIASHQTGVYPCATPGGWRLIGRTPLQMFRADRSEMSLLAMGDRVRFTPISRDQFAALRQDS